MSRATFIRSILGLPSHVGKTPIAVIVRKVSLVTGISADRIVSRERTQAVAHARQQVFPLAVSEGHSLTQIGAFFSLDHSTINHGINAVQARANRQTA